MTLSEKTGSCLFPTRSLTFNSHHHQLKLRSIKPYITIDLVFLRPNYAPQGSHLFRELLSMRIPVSPAQATLLLPLFLHILCSTLHNILPGSSSLNTRKQEQEEKFPLICLKRHSSFLPVCVNSVRNNWCAQ